MNSIIPYETHKSHDLVCDQLITLNINSKENPYIGNIISNERELYKTHSNYITYEIEQLSNLLQYLKKNNKSTQNKIPKEQIHSLTKLIKRLNKTLNKISNLY